MVQSFKDDPLTECPACGGQLRKVFSPVGIVFKGSGFYKTDSRGREDRHGEGQGEGVELVLLRFVLVRFSSSSSGSSSGSSSDSSSGSSSGSGADSAKKDSKIA